MTMVRVCCPHCGNDLVYYHRDLHKFFCGMCEKEV